MTEGAWLLWYFKRVVDDVIVNKVYIPKTWQNVRIVVFFLCCLCVDDAEATCNHGNKERCGFFFYWLWRLKFTQLIQASSVVPCRTWSNRKWPWGRARAPKRVRKQRNKVIKVKPTCGIKRHHWKHQGQVVTSLSVSELDSHLLCSLLALLFLSLCTWDNSLQDKNTAEVTWPPPDSA